MREIQVAEHKTLKLTNVLSRKVEVEDMGNLAIVLTQMQNFIRSHDAMPVGPIVQCLKMRKGPNPTAEIYFMQQVNQLIPRLDPGAPGARLPVRPLHRPHELQQPRQPETGYLCVRA